MTTKNAVAAQGQALGLPRRPVLRKGWWGGPPGPQPGQKPARAARALWSRSTNHLFVRAAAILAIVFYGTLRADQVDDIVKAEMSQQHIPGLALAVIKDGRVIRSAGYGLANVELNVPVTPRTVFKIGSISKQFIASGIMILVQEGKL